MCTCMTYRVCQAVTCLAALVQDYLLDPVMQDDVYAAVLQRAGTDPLWYAPAVESARIWQRTEMTLSKQQLDPSYCVPCSPAVVLKCATLLKRFLLRCAALYTCSCPSSCQRTMHLRVRARYIQCPCRCPPSSDVLHQINAFVSITFKTLSADRASHVVAPALQALGYVQTLVIRLSGGQRPVNFK